MMDALTGKRFCLKRAALKLQDSKCFHVILSFFKDKTVMNFQQLS